VIIVRLRGGIGNQLFQFAMARALGERLGAPLVFELSGLTHTRATVRRFELGLFNLGIPISTMEEAVQGPIVVQVTERTRGFHPEVMRIGPSGCLVLSGLWHSERYFAHAEVTIRRELSFGPGMESEYSRAIRSCNAVALHVRRGDYLQPFSRQFAVLSPAYYHQAVERLAAGLQRPHFFIFSDDPDWCEQNLDIRHAHTVIRGPGTPDDRTGEDLWLMHLCRHFIIANSTYSWWGAWLGTAADKQVCAPHEWYRDDPDRRLTRDLLPPSWHVL